MNAISNVASEVRPGLTLHRQSLNRWFNNNGGTEISGLEKPLDSEKHKKLRKEWVITYYGLLTCLYNPVAYIDEKWFYRTNRCRKIKILKLGAHEKKGADKIVLPKMLSWRFPVKSIFIGVVGRPIPYHNFDGKIFLERVSKKRYISKCTAHSNFSDDAIVHAEIKMGKWIKYIADFQLSVSELKEIFYLNYDLDYATID